MTAGKVPTVIDRYAEVTAYIANITSASDANRDSLGFYPSSVFEDFARRGGLFVLLTSRESGQCFAGHLLFQRQFPRASILQLYIAPEYRGLGYARVLCDRLAEDLTSEGFLSIYAGVAEDLTEANSRWESLASQFSESGRVASRQGGPSWFGSANFRALSYFRQETLILPIRLV